MPDFVLREQPRNEIRPTWPFYKKIVIWSYQNIVPWIAYGFVMLITSTYRWRQMVSKELLELMSSGKPFAVAIWHGDMVFSQSLGKRLGWNNRSVVMVALNQPGEVEARILKRLGYYVIRGSAKKRGKEALEDMKGILSQGAIAAMVVDGPIGPARDVKAGVVELARFCQVPIVPVAFLPGKEWVLPTWDRTRIPRPFSRCITTSTIPIRVPRTVGGGRFEKIREDIKEVLIDLEQRKVTWHQAFSLDMKLLSLFGARNTIIRIEGATKGLAPGKFAKDEKACSYVIAELRGMGTELKGVNKKYYKDLKLEIDWKRFYKTQQTILDTCRRGDPKEVWKIVTETVPALKKDIEGIIDRVPLWNVSKLDLPGRRRNSRDEAPDAIDSGKTRKAGDGRV